MLRFAPDQSLFLSLPVALLFSFPLVASASLCDLTWQGTLASAASYRFLTSDALAVAVPSANPYL
jgi:hypothetical protein